MRKLGLLTRLILAIILGIAVGTFGNVFIIRIFATISSIFGEFLKFIIPLIIVGFVAAGIANLSKRAGRLLGFNVAIAYISTIVSGVSAYLIVGKIFPYILENSKLTTGFDNPEGFLLTGFINVSMPPVMGVMTALILAFVVGLGVNTIKGDTLKNCINDFQAIITKVIQGVIIPLLPLYIVGIFANITYAGQFALIFFTMIKVFAIIIILQISIIILQYILAAMISRSNPFSLIKTMLPAYFTAIGTQSSAATIPVTLRQTIRNGVNEEIADFAIPLSATIHLSGSTITLVVCANAIMYLYGIEVSFSTFMNFIFLLGFTMVAAPGVPGGGVIAALGIIETMLGFSQPLLSLMISLYLAQDSFGTACNVMGDGALAVIINKIAGYKLKRNKNNDSEEN